MSDGDDFREDLAKLQTRLKDTLAGFDALKEEAAPEIQPIVGDFIALHTKHETTLSAHLRNMGAAPDEDGSFFSTIQRAVIKTRAVFGDMDEDILDQVVQGEEWVEGLYDAAISSAPTPEETALLTGQRMELTTLIDRARKLAD